MLFRCHAKHIRLSFPNRMLGPVSFAPVTACHAIRCTRTSVVKRGQHTPTACGQKSNMTTQQSHAFVSCPTCPHVLEYAGTHVTAVGQEVSAGAFRDAVPRMPFRKARDVFHLLKH